MRTYKIPVLLLLSHPVWKSYLIRLLGFQYDLMIIEKWLRLFIGPRCVWTLRIKQCPL